MLFGLSRAQHALTVLREIHRHSPTQPIAPQSHRANLTAHRTHTLALHFAAQTSHPREHGARNVGASPSARASSPSRSHHVVIQPLITLITSPSHDVKLTREGKGVTLPHTVSLDTREGKGVTLPHGVIDTPETT